MLCIMYTGSQSLPADSNKSNMGSTVLNHLGPNMIHCTGHKYWHYDIMTSWHHMNDITCMVTEGCPPLVALHMHCWLRTGQLWCMWNSQSVHLKVFWNLCPCLLAFAPCCDFGCSGGGTWSVWKQEGKPQSLHPTDSNSQVDEVQISASNLS